MMKLLSGYWVSRAIYTAAKLGVADAIHELGAGDPVSVGQIAARIGVEAGSLGRLLRALASTALFREADGGHRFALGDLGEHLLSDSPYSLRNAAIMYGEEFATAWDELPSTIRDGVSGWDKAFGVRPFEWYPNHPEPARIFDQAMKELGRAMYSDEAIAASYEFPHGAMLVELGGGLGNLLASIVARDPTLHALLFDREQVIERARRIHQNESRIRCASGNFFESLPDGADAYLLKRVLHDWEDGESEAILRNIVRVMKPTGRVLVIEAIVPSGPEDHFSKWLDLHMLVLNGGRERTEGEFAELFARAGLELRSVHHTPTILNIIEGVRKD
jgi:ubiquinone/menaquinone biosynthesis C-methylase UbiE